MPNSQPLSSRPHVELRKYPNRRYYDSQRSCHVTLEEIHEMIRSGAEVHVTDSKSGDDITAKVLAQIILEHDPPKLGILPVELLHQLIRANEPLIREFVDKYFSQAFMVFVESQRQFDRYLRKSLGLEGTAADWANTGADWAHMMMAPLRSMLRGPPVQQTRPHEEDNGAQEPEEAADPGGAAASATPAQLQTQLDDLRQQLVLLQHQLAQQGPSGLAPQGPSDHDRARMKRPARSSLEKPAE